MSDIITYNLTGPAPTSLTKPLTITAQPGVDMWRSPPDHLVATAPIVVASRLPAAQFKSFTLTVKFTVTDLYDQAGLILQFPDQDGTKWIKAGVEKKEHSFLSVVATQGYSDWSLAPLTKNQEGELVTSNDVEVRLKLERVYKAGKPASAAWIYRVWPDDTLQPLRETTWAFDGTDRQNIEIGLYVACPSETRNGPLTAEFRDLQIDSYLG